MKKIINVAIYKGCAVLITDDGKIMMVYFDPKQNCFYLKDIILLPCE